MFGELWRSRYVDSLMGWIRRTSNGTIAIRSFSIRSGIGKQKFTSSAFAKVEETTILDAIHEFAVDEVVGKTTTKSDSDVGALVRSYPLPESFSIGPYYMHSI